MTSRALPAHAQRSERRIGLFGGSFDPVHEGHLHVARAARAAFDLDGVVFMPAAEPPHKLGQVLAPGAQRLAMLRLAVAGEPEFSVSDHEIERGGRSYTIDTVRALPKLLGERDDVPLYLLMGSDNLPGLPRWHEAHALLERVQPVVLQRGGVPEEVLDALRAELGTELADKVRRGYLRLPPVLVSSTELRSASLQGTLSDLLLPAAVRRYILEHGLYGAARS